MDQVKSLLNSGTEQITHAITPEKSNVGPRVSYMMFYLRVKWGLFVVVDNSA